jgi:hypothetical protein
MHCDTSDSRNLPTRHCEAFDAVFVREFLRDERKTLIDLEYLNRASESKHLIAISTSALGLSLVILGLHIQPLCPPVHTSLLFGSWAALLLAIVFQVLSLRLEAAATRKFRDIIDAWFADPTPERAMAIRDSQEQVWQGHWQARASLAGWVFFVAGLAVFTCFVGCNLN